MWLRSARDSDRGAANELRLVKSRGGQALAAVKFAPPPLVDTAPRTASGFARAADLIQEARSRRFRDVKMADAVAKGGSEPPKQRTAEGPRFSSLTPPLRPESLEVLAAQGFERATPVQGAAIGLLAGNKDVAVEACTGSGKTLAFVLPMVEILARASKEQSFRKHHVGAVVVSPTRELARQIFDVAAPFMATLPNMAPPMLLVGGTDVNEDVRAFAAAGAAALIGTPGRLDDLMLRSAAFDAKRCELLVLDEADRLLSMGFARAINAIIARLPKQRRTGLFSATQTDEVEELARAGLRNPVRVTVRDAAAQAAANAAKASGLPANSAAARGKLPAQLKLLYKVCRVDERLWRLREFLKENADKKTIVYFLTCACVDYFATAMCDGAPASPGDGVDVVALHGKMKQSQREQALARFASGAGGCLLCTDVAARGLDIPGVDWVVQFDAPQDPAAFVHRVGRTARMGRDGSALLFLSPHESSYVEFLRVRHIHLREVDGLDVDEGAAGGDGAGGAGDAKEAGLKALREEMSGGGVEEEEDDEDDEDDEDEEDREGSEEESEDEESEDEESEEEASEEEESEEEGSEEDAADSEAVEGGNRLCDELRARSEKNREAMEKGVRAFVSYLRGYKEHHCRFIFRFKELELARLARSLGLLRLPRMKEIRKAPKSSLKGFTESSVNPDAVPFEDRAREKQRQRALAEEAARRAANPEANADSRKEREKRKREEAAAAAAKAQHEKRLTAAKRRQVEAQDDFDDLDDDYRALKKLKKGKISEEEFDFELGFEQPDGMSKRDRELAAERAGKKQHHKQPTNHVAMQGAALKASMRKPRDNKPRHLKNSKAKGGGRSKKSVKKAFKKSGGAR